MTTRAELLAAIEAEPLPYSAPWSTSTLHRSLSESVRFRVLTIAENDSALADAHAYVDGIKMSHEGQARDRMLSDSLAIEIILRATFLGDEQLFPSSDWLRERLSTDQLATLLDAYNAHYRASSPLKLAVTDDGVRDLAEAIRSTQAAGGDSQALLAACPREWLAEAFVRLSLLSAQPA